MKFKDIILEYLLEQPDPVADENPQDDNLQGDNPQQDDEPEQDDAEPEQDNTQPTQGQTPENKPKKEKKLTPFELQKNLWRQEVPGIEEGTLEAGVEFFNRVKTGLQPISTDQQRRNQPEILAASLRFEHSQYPDFYGNLSGKKIVDTFKDVNKLRDIKHYTWEVIEFLIDRFSEAEARENFDFSIEGDTPDIRMQSAISKWNKSQNKIIDEGGLIVFRAQSKDEARVLGLLQNILVGQYGGQTWCACRLGEDSMYNNYRNRRSYYFVMDKNKSQDDRYFISVLQPVDKNTSSYSYEGPYVITPRPNGDQTGKSWEDVVSIYPGLRGKENLIVFFGETNKEKVDKSLSHINFNKNDQRNYFGYQSPQLQFEWVDSNRLINDPEAFLLLRKEHQTEYVRRVSLEDYKNRFKSNNSQKPFAMLDVLSKNDVKTLHQRMKEIRIPDGIFAVKAAILRIQYDNSFVDIDNPNIMLFQDKLRKGVFGVLDLSNLSWVKSLEYIKGRSSLYVNPETKQPFVLRTYVNSAGDDYFYLQLPKENLLAKDRENLKGRYLDAEQGNELVRKSIKL